MKILSISDVITNSSSEVFCYYDKESDKKLRNLLKCIFETFGVNEPLDEICTIEYHLSSAAEYDNVTTVKEALESCCDSEGHSYISYYDVIPRSPKYKSLCALLSNLDSMFEYAEVYC